jgi:hypothetical protein
LSAKDGLSQSNIKVSDQIKVPAEPPAEEKKGIKCFICRELVPVDRLAKHVAICMNPDKKDKLMQASVSHDVYKESFPEDLVNSVSRSSAVKKTGSLP